MYVSHKHLICFFCTLNVSNAELVCIQHLYLNDHLFEHFYQKFHTNYFQKNNYYKLVCQKFTSTFINLKNYILVDENTFFVYLEKFSLKV